MNNFKHEISKIKTGDYILTYETGDVKMMTKEEVMVAHVELRNEISDWLNLVDEGRMKEAGDVAITIGNKFKSLGNQLRK